MGATDQVTSRVDIDSSPPRVERFLKAVWGDSRGWVNLPYRDRKGYWHEDPIDSTVLPVLHLDDFYQRGDQYFCPLVFRYRSRKAEFALPTRVLWADLDAADPRGVRLRPSCAWESSQGRFQALWFIGCDCGQNKAATQYDPSKGILPGDCWACGTPTSIPATKAAALSRCIAYAEPGCDRSGWDVTQVLRLPGTLNHKYDPPQQVKFLWATKHAYTLAEVEAAYPQGQSSKTFHVGTMFPASDFPQLHEASVAAKRALLPVGLQYELERAYDGRDRSAWLFTTAGHLLGAGVPPAVVVELLRRTALNKFAGRSDETQRLRETVSQAMGKRGDVNDD